MLKYHNNNGSLRRAVFLFANGNKFIKFNYLLTK